MNRRSLLALGLSLVAAGGCASQPALPDGATVDVEPFIAAARRSGTVDFSPLTSPRHAVEVSDVIARGRLVDIVTTGPLDDGPSQYATHALIAAVSVTKAIHGNPPTTVHIHLADPPAHVLDQSVRNFPRGASALIIARNFTRDFPADAWPKEVPRDAMYLWPLADGLWIQGGKNSAALNPYTEVEQFAPAWGRPQTLDDLERAITQAK